MSKILGRSILFGLLSLTAVLVGQTTTSGAAPATKLQVSGVAFYAVSAPAGCSRPAGSASTSFSDSTGSILAYVTFKGFTGTHKVRFRWSGPGRRQFAPAAKKLHAAKHACSTLTLQTENPAAAPGTWTLTILIDGKQVKRSGFEIVASPTPTTVPTSTPVPAATATASPAPSGAVPPTATPVPTKPAIDVSGFALPITLFPKGSVAIKSGPESNDQAQAETYILHLDPQSFAAEGRITGYFMAARAENQDTSGSHPVVTSYLVSIYGSTDQAQAAFAAQLKGLQAKLAGSDLPQPPSNFGVGDPGASAVYIGPTTIGSDTVAVNAILFRRGRVLVEVDQFFYQTNGQNTYLPASIPAWLDISKELDKRAQSVTLPS